MTINPTKNLQPYILVLDLDETLVHYEDQESEGIIHIRPHLNEFLIEM